jgi:ferrochelatase
MREAQYNRPTDVTQPFDAVLLIAFGGPQAPGDVRPFLENVLHGRNVPQTRVDEVAHHYELVGGRSPITELTQRQAEGLQRRLASAGRPLPVRVGMRNWHPYLADTLAEMSRAGVRRAVGFIAAAHRSYSSCTQYRENVAEARRALSHRHLADVEITYVSDWYTHPGFVAANAARIADALEQLEPRLRRRARIVFTAHSIPVSMAERYPYASQIAETCQRVADHVRDADPTDHADRQRDADRTDHVLVYQSRSGRPEDPWLGPDVCDYLRDERARGLEAAVICPIGFICDHVEVLYDLDIEAADVAEQ